MGLSMKQKILLSFTAFPSILFGSSLSMFKKSIEASAENDKTTFDYSITDAKLELKASDILGKILEKQGDFSSISEAEITYLDSNFAFAIDDNSNKNYNVSYLDNCYWIEAFEDKNFTPKYVSVMEGDEEKHFDFVRLNKQLISRAPTLDNARIHYERKFEIKPEDANKILVSAYNTGKKEAENIALNEKYNLDLNTYNAYLEDLAKYKQYLKEKATYDALKESRDNYLALKKQYDSDYAKYLQYKDVDYPNYVAALQNYNAYLEELDAYNKNKNIYDELVETYNNKMAIVDRQLKILDILTTNYGDLHLSIYYFINSSSVDVVIKRRSEIVTACGSALGPAIDEAKESTEIAKQIINDYYKIKDSTKEVKYKWYQSFYTPLLRQIVKLTRCLEHFYSIKLIRDVIAEKGKTEKYELFVAELIYFCNAISDSNIVSYNNSNVLDSTRKIGGVASTYTSLLKDELIDVSLISEPFKGAYPTVPVEFDTAEPEEVLEPEEPKYVSKPIEPTLVEEPTPVELVEKPAEVKEPTNPNVTIHSELKYLADAYNSSLLFDRQKLNSKISINITQTVDIDSQEAKDMLIVFDTRDFENSGFAKFREIVYFDDPSNIVFATKLTSMVGVFSTNEEAIDVALDGKGVVKSNVSNNDPISFIENQMSGFKQYNVIWNHVENNDEKINFVDLDYSISNTSYELLYPTYGFDGQSPSHPDLYLGSKRTYAYIFEGYDYTDTKDETDLGISGLSTADDISEVQGNPSSIVINVVFNKVECFDVTFEGQGSVSYLKGSSVNAPEVIPTKEPTASVRYEFVGYTKTGSSELVTFPVTVEEDVEFKPVFKEIPIYKITFEADGKVISSQNVEKNKTPELPLNVTKERTENSYFTFKSWDSEVISASEDKKYTAVFEEHTIISNASISEDVLSLNVTVNESDNTVSFANVFSLMDKEEIELKAINVKFASADIELNKTLVNYLKSVDGVTLSLEKTTLENEKFEFVLKVKDSQGSELSNSSLSIPVLLKNIPDVSHSRMFVNNNEIASEVINSNVKVGMKLGSKVVVSHFYKVYFDKYLSAATFKLNNQDVEAGSIYEFKKGDVITLNATENDGYRLNSLLVTNSTGGKLTLNNDSITINNSDIYVSADIERIMCTINLYVDNIIFQSITTTYGSLLNLPTNITKPSTDDCYYVFTGWDQDVTIADKNYNLNAKFDTINKLKAKGEEENNDGKMTFGQKLSIGVLAVFGAGFAAAIALVARKPRNSSLKKGL